MPTCAESTAGTARLRAAVAVPGTTPAVKRCGLQSRQGYAALILLTVSTVVVAANDSARLRLTSPPARWEEASPLGKGRLGAMAFGGATHEHRQLKEDTLDSGSPGHRDVRWSIPL